MSSQIITDYEKAMLRSEVPSFKAGDTVRVSLKIAEGDKERLQDFEGVCIRRKGSGITETITLRKTNYGVGIERIIPVHSPKVDSIRVVRFGRVRRAKLYYLRDLTGKAARITEKKTAFVSKAERRKIAAAEVRAAEAEADAQALAQSNAAAEVTKAPAAEVTPAENASPQE